MGVADATAVTMSFLTLAFAQLWHVFNMSGVRESPWRNDITTNPWIWAALGVSTVLLLFAMYVPGLASVMNVVSLDGEEWLVVMVASLVPLILATAARPLRRRFA
jgi:Ca2+-transporting ATPase